MSNTLRNLSNILNTLERNKAIYLTITRNYAFKSDLKIKWVRPEKIVCYKPEKSGDLEQFTVADIKQVNPKFKNSKELQTADEMVKRLFSLEFSPRRAQVDLYLEHLTNRVKRHDYDLGSIEVKIAKWTGVIRAWQEVMDQFPRNKIIKVALKELIDKRKKHLKYLRRWDYKKFEWLLEQLNLTYKPMPLDVHWVTRKDSLRKLTDKYCDEVKSQKLEEYKLKLQTEQPSFLKEKIRCLEYIRNEQKDAGLKVTVTEKDIEDVKTQLAELLEKNKKEEVE